MRKRKYAAVGTGGRIPMFIDPIAGKYHEADELVGLCDLSPTRSSHHQKRLMRQYGLAAVPTYTAAEFDRMLAEQKPDVVIACVPHYLHHDYGMLHFFYSGQLMVHGGGNTWFDRHHYIIQKCRFHYPIFEVIDFSKSNSSPRGEGDVLNYPAP